MIYSSPPLSLGDTFQDSQQKPEIMDSTELYIHCALPTQTDFLIYKSDTVED